MKSFKEASKEIAEHGQADFGDFYMTLSFHQDPAYFEFWNKENYKIADFPFCRNEVFMEMRHTSLVKELTNISV